jgi:hypothetical protein
MAESELIKIDLLAHHVYWVENKGPSGGYKIAVAVCQNVWDAFREEFLVGVYYPRIIVATNAGELYGLFRCRSENRPTRILHNVIPSSIEAYLMAARVVRAENVDDVLKVPAIPMWK